MKRHVRTFSRVFPKGHPREGQPTYFVEKFHWSINTLIHKNYPFGGADQMLRKLNADKPIDLIDNFIDSLDDDTTFDPKHHTIRGGHHIKVGDVVSFRVWSGKPYNSKQIIIAPDIEIKKTWDFEMKPIPEADMNIYGFINDILIESPAADKLANNDGLSLEDFTNWFIPKKNLSGFHFNGQIICWNDKIEY